MSKGLDRLFGVDTLPDSAAPPEHSSPVVKAVSLNSCRDLPIDALVDMEQPFHLYDSEEMEAMRQSISAHGVIQRLVVRPYCEEGMYQIISGRNRRTGAREAGYTTVPCEIRYHLDDMEAELLMIATNLEQRKKIPPSEKARAYRRRLEIMNRQGMRTDLTLVHDGQRPKGSVSRDLLALEVSDSSTQIHRYIRLSYLIPELLEATDQGKLGLVIGEALSFLDTDSQRVIYHHFFEIDPHPISKHLADQLRLAGEHEKLTEERICLLLNKTPERPKTIKSVPVRPLRKFFPKGTSETALQKTLLAALQMYFDAGNNIIEK